MTAPVIRAGSLVRAAACAFALAAGAPTARAQGATDTSFAGLVARFSEPTGYFDSDNIISNESSYLQVASQLRSMRVHGGVYIGVGPDQNFSYIALTQPSIAFIVDIRRDNLLEQLLFKALFTVARNRLEYLCLLLGKPAPAELEDWIGRPLPEMLDYIRKTPVDSAAVRTARKEVRERMTRFGVPLDQRDLATIQRYWTEFIASGLDTRFSSLGRDNRLNYPSLGEMIAATDRSGQQLGYLASESAFLYVRSMELRGRIVPVVGNLAGPKALAAIGAYAAQRGLVVSAFYVSNVEQYLMGREGGFTQYADNVKKLPRDSTSVLIRSYFQRGGRTHPLYVAGNNSVSMVEPIAGFVHAYDAGLLHTYDDLVFSGYVEP